MKKTTWIDGHTKSTSTATKTIYLDVFEMGESIITGITHETYSWFSKGLDRVCSRSKKVDKVISLTNL